jgi:hypothetical protein
MGCSVCMLTVAWGCGGENRLVIMSVYLSKALPLHMRLVFEVLYRRAS